jgi:ABC-type antimicrobial peptide transport system permease subunit
MVAIFFGGSLSLALFGIWMTLMVSLFYTLFYLLEEELEKQAEAAGHIFC